MHLSRLRLRDFRNYGRLDVAFGPGFHLLLGENAQGKTNLLEAIYLVATLRSFRSATGPQMVRHGQKGYFIGANVVGQGERAIRMYWAPQERKVTLDERSIRKLSDYFGVLRAVVFCAEDLQLVKGAAARRRRFLDLLLAQSGPGYLPLLQRYSLALRSRNMLLKRRGADPAALESFTQELIPLGNRLMEFRRKLVPRLSALTRLAYRRIAGGREELRIEYEPSARRDFALDLAQSRARELVYRSTVVGPHRDDIELLIDDQAAAQFASEGQKRSIAIALKLAQAEYVTGMHGAPPVLLIDDVMGELDASRRKAFLPLLQTLPPGRGQVFMTVTQENWPRDLGVEITRWQVDGGTLRRL